MSTKILEAVRAKYPQYSNIDDAELTKRLADKYPQYLKDEEFAKSAMPMLSDEQRAGLMTMRASELPKASQGVSTIAGGPPVSFGGGSFLPANDYAESGRIIPQDPAEALSAPSVWAKRGGTLLLGAMADLASTMKGEPSTANMGAYATGEEMPVEIGLKEMHGLSSIPTKAAAGLIQAAPAIGLSGALAMGGAPSTVAAALPMLTDHEGQIDPYGATIAAGLPGVSKVAEKFVGQQLAKLPTAHVVAEVLSRDPLKIKAKVVQRLGGLEISNDTFRKYLEAGGGAVAANAYLLASQTPEILSLPPEQRGEAILDSVAANLGVSMLAFSSRPGASETLRELQPKLRKLWEQAQADRAIGGKPAATSGGAAQPSTAPVPPLPVAEAAPAVPAVPVVPNVPTPTTAPAPENLTAENAKSAETPAATVEKPLDHYETAKKILLDAYQRGVLPPGKGIQLVQLHTPLTAGEAEYAVESASKEFIAQQPEPESDVPTPFKVGDAVKYLNDERDLTVKEAGQNTVTVQDKDGNSFTVAPHQLKANVTTPPQPSLDEQIAEKLKDRPAAEQPEILRYEVSQDQAGNWQVAVIQKFASSGYEYPLYIRKTAKNEQAAREFAARKNLELKNEKAAANVPTQADAGEAAKLQVTIDDYTATIEQNKQALKTGKYANGQPVSSSGRERMVEQNKSLQSVIESFQVKLARLKPSSTPSEPAPTVPTPTSPQAGSATATSSTAPAELAPSKTEITREQAIAIFAGRAKLLPKKGQTIPQPGDTSGEYFIGLDEAGNYFTEHRPKKVGSETPDAPAASTVDEILAQWKFKKQGKGWIAVTPENHSFTINANLWKSEADARKDVRKHIVDRMERAAHYKALEEQQAAKEPDVVERLNKLADLFEQNNWATRLDPERRLLDRFSTFAGVEDENPQGVKLGDVVLQTYEPTGAQNLGIITKVEDSKYATGYAGGYTVRVATQHGGQGLHTGIANVEKTGQNVLETPDIFDELKAREAELEKENLKLKYEQGKVGGKLKSGEQVLTSSGRLTTPFPEIKTGSARKTADTVRKVDLWLRDNAIAEAESRNDDFNAQIFKAETGKTIPQASKDAMEEYLFGEQPAVPKPVLKDVKPAEPVTEPQNESELWVAAKKKVSEGYQVGEFNPETKQWRKVELFPTDDEASKGLAAFEANGNEHPSLTKPVAPAPAGASKPEELAQHIRQQLVSGADLMAKDVRALAAQFGLTDKEAAEWAELGATMAARDIVRMPEMTHREKFMALVSLYNRMPTNGERTVDTKVKQQYSTPPPLAFACAVLADFENGTAFGEPTAGNGMLLIGVPNDMAAVMANELDDARRLRLKLFLKDQNITRRQLELGNFDPLGGDATSSQMHNLFTQAKLDRVAMNPPFGSVLGSDGKNKKFEIFNASTKQKETTSIDAAIMLNTFDALTPEGKGFAIIGAKTGNMYATMADDKTRSEDYNKPVFLDLFNRFNVVDWFTIGGDLYRKMGAAWPVDVIIVHGKGKTPGAANGGMVRPWVKPPRVIESWEELAKLLPEKSYDNIKPAAPEASGIVAKRKELQNSGYVPAARGDGWMGPNDVKFETTEKAYEHLKSRTTGGKAGASSGGTHPESPAKRTGGRGDAQVSDEGHQRPAADSGAGRGDQPQTPVVPNPTPEPPQGVNAVTGAGIGTGTPEASGGVAGSGAASQKPRTPAVGGGGPVAAGPSPTQSGRKPVEPAKAESGKVAAPPAKAETSPVKPSVPVEGLPADLVVPYKGASRGPSLNLVAPRNIAEAMLKAQQGLEQQTGKSIDQFLAEKLLRTPAVLHTQLSGAQIDTAALAIYNIERGGGLICAHQGGVGKGRIVASMGAYCKARGLIMCFVTAKKNLYEDMVARDMPAVGDKDYIPFITDTNYTYEDGNGKVVKGRGTAATRAAEMEKIIRTGQLPNGAHGIFTTYDQLKGDKPAGFKESPKEKFKRQVNKVERPDGARWAMLRALAPRMVFVLDEAHEAAGPTSEINRKFASVLPLAHGVYYSSATFAKRPDNLGLYALGTSIKNSGLDNEALAEALKAGGVPLQQALTSMLADSGELVRCEQDWTGVPIEFKQTSTNATKDIEAADTYTSFIRDLMQLAKVVNVGIKSLEDTENQVRAEEQEVAVEPITFGSRLFNLSNQYLLALRSDAIVSEALAELKAGRKPFIALYNTMEGPLLDLKARKLPLTFNGILLREMQKMLVITVRDPQAENGQKKVELKPEDLPDGGAFYRQLEKQIMETDFSRLPISPIDHIKKGLTQAGYTCSELTARDGEVNDDGGEVTIEKREKQERNRILKDYNHGKTDVIIVNGSGSTGLSAHTDPAFKDQRQRVMIVGQPAPDINQFMQMMWRVMRSGQTSKPKYKILNTALAAERRFTTMLRGKMTSLNASTTADGESGMTQQEGFAEDIFNEIGDRVVQRVMEANQDLADLIELETGSDEDGNGPEGFARKATGRFVLLPNADAQRLWDEIISEFKDEIQQLDEQGQNPLRATAEDLKARTLERTELVQGTGNTKFDGPAWLEKCLIKPPKAPPTHAEAKQRASENLPAIKAAVKVWMDNSFKAQDARVATMRQRGSTDKQIEAATKAFDNVRQLVREAQWKLGETWGVDFTGAGVTSYGVAAELRLSDKNVADFASASRQQLILTTNTFKGKLTVPLSKLTRADGSGDVLQAVDEDRAAEVFNANSESSAERYIVTGNLLRGWEAAANAGGGTGGRPRVAIYTLEDGSLATGILMPPGWSADGAGEAGGKLQPVTNENEFGDAIINGQAMRGTGAWANLIEIEGYIVRVKSNMAGRKVWGAQNYKGFFNQSPTQNGSWMVGTLRGHFRSNVLPFYQLLKDAGVTLGIVTPGETSAMKANTGSGQNLPTSAASARGGFVSGVNTAPGKVPPSVTYGGMNFVHPLELPELVRLVRELTGRTPSVRKLPQRGGMKTYGVFGDGMISLDPSIFNDSLVAAQVLGHEIGHLVDYLPHETLRRGNLLGHLLALRSFLKGTFGPLNNKDLRKELLAVTMWWRPYNPLTDPPSYVQYRESAEELYADALSVLFNAPAELETRAPKFYEAFWKHINARPDVQTSLFGIQDLLNKGMLPTAKEREDELLKGFKQGEDTWRQAVLDRQKAARSWDGWWTRVGMELYWNFFPLEQRAAQVEKRGVTLPARKDPRVFLDDLGFKDVRVMAWGRVIHEKVIQPLEEAGLTLEDAGKYLFYTRVMAGDRSGLANPGGFTPRAAQLGLLKMNLELKLPKMTLLRDIIRRFHDETFKLAEQAVEVGAYNRQTFDTVIAPNKDAYATFAVLDYLDDYLPPSIRQQIGTFKAIANPFHATILKSIGLINLIEYQKAKNGVVNFINEFYPGDMEKSEAQHEPPAPKDRGIFMRLENGRPVYYITDPFIADAFQKVNSRQLRWFTKAADGIFRKIFYPLFITYNPSFLYFMSPLRDIQRAGRNLPGGRISVGTLPVDYGRNLVETGKRYLGESGPLIREMEANLALGTPFDQIARQHRDDFMGDLLRKMRVLPDHEIQGIYSTKIFQPIRKMLDAMEAGGMTLDALAKTASYSKLRRMGLSPKDAAYFVRNYTGLPNINKKGLLAREARALVPFWNVFMQGWRADARLMSHPTTRSGWWFRYMMSNGLVRALIAAGAAGALGEAIKELFAGISEYQKTNYLTVPIGKTSGGDFGGKTIYVRIPENETDRIIGGIIYKGVTTLSKDNKDGLSGIFDFGVDQIPSVNPALTVPLAWAQFARGNNPEDSFRNAPVVPRKNWNAGGWEATQPMLTWTLQQSGALNFFRYDPTANSTMELAVSATPGLNSFVKVSDAGRREQQRKTQDEIQAQRDMQFLKLSDKVQSLELEYWRLQRTPKETRTDAQAERLNELYYWYGRVYRPAWESILDAEADKKTDLANQQRAALDKESAEFYRNRK